MPVQVNALRLSLIWVETTLSLIRDPEPPDAPMRFLGRIYWYAPTFKKVQKSPGALKAGSPPIALQPPWPAPAGQIFWTHYFGGTRPGDVGGEAAWVAGAPFRGRFPASISANWWPGRFGVEAFFYPHGVALVMTAACENQDLSLEQAVDLTFSVRRTGKFGVRWASGTAEDLSLAAFADKALITLRQIAYGAHAAPGQRIATDPFTIVTVLKGSGDDSSALTAANATVCRALEALTTWRPTWKSDSPPPDLEEACLKRKRTPENGVLYGRKRGRAIWFPDYFTKDDPTVNSLACYHRNLLLASLQVDSLSGLVIESAERLALKPLSTVNRHCAVAASENLEKLYLGDDGVYRTWSARAQIDQNNYKAPLNQIRAAFGRSLIP